MNKKLISLGLCILITHTLSCIVNIGHYENIIAREFNRHRAGASYYSSINTILNQTLKGKSAHQKNNIIADVRSLKYAIYTAREQAKNDGVRLWHWLYLYKDNQLTIEILNEYYNDAHEKLKELEWEMNSDIIKGSWYVAPYIVSIIAGMILVWASQNYLSKEYYKEHNHHGLIEIFEAPFYATGDYIFSKKIEK